MKVYVTFVNGDTKMFEGEVAGIIAAELDIAYEDYEDNTGKPPLTYLFRTDKCAVYIFWNHVTMVKVVEM